METHPPIAVERVVARFVPQTCREHVMGDLFERYRSPRQYLVDAARTIPFVVASQVRRQSSASLVAAEACGIYISFTAASMLAGPRYLFESSAAVPLLAAIAVALVVLVLRDAYANPAERSARSAFSDAALAMLAVLLSQDGFDIVAPKLALPAWLMIAGGSMSVLTVGWLRTFYESGIGRPAAGEGQPTLEDLRRRSQELHRRAWRLNLAWLSAALVVMVLMQTTFPFRTPLRTFVFSIVIFVSLLWGWFRFKQGKAGPVERWTSLAISSDPYRMRLAAKRDALRLWSGMGQLWDLGGYPVLFLVIIGFPLFLVLLAWIFRQPLPANLDGLRLWITLPGFVVLCAFLVRVRTINERAARALQQEIEALDAAEKEQ